MRHSACRLQRACASAHHRTQTHAHNRQGHVSDYSLRQSNCSVCVVRSTSPPAAADGGQDYMFATDGSKAAALAFCSLVHQ